MKKILALIALTTALCICAFACSSGSGSDSSGEKDNSSQTTDSSSSGNQGDVSSDSSSSGKKDDKPDDSTGGDDEPEYESSSDVAVTYAKLVEIMNSFAKRQNYKTTMSGKTVASVMNYTQNINSVVIRDGDAWKSDYTSSSTLVNLLHNLYTQGDKVLYKEKEKGNTTKCAPADYRKKFGVLPYDGMFGGYDIAQSHVLSAKYTKDANGLTMELTVNGNAVSDNMKVQMKKFGDLNKLPDFKKLTFKLYCSDGENLSWYETYAEYKIEKTIIFSTEMDCKMNLKTTVYDCSEKLTVPEKL